MDGSLDDPREAAFTAQEEQRAGFPPRPMLTRTEAMAKPNAYFREEEMPGVAVSATPNPPQGLWIVGHHDPAHPDELIIGNGPLVVPTNDRVNMSGGSIPPWPEEIGLEEPESWRYDRGDDLLPGSWADRLGGQDRTRMVTRNKQGFPDGAADELVLSELLAATSAMAGVPHYLQGWGRPSPRRPAAACAGRDPGPPNRRQRGPSHDRRPTR